MNESMTSPIILIFWLTHFNPRSYERSDLKRLKMRLTHLKFQSTLLRKERPRPHQILTVLFFVSIHAPTKGATYDRYIQENEKRVSIHAPTKGATYTAGRGGLYYMFQSTLLRKERLKIPPLAYQSTLFQSTLLRKERLFNISPVVTSTLFQSTLLRKERRLMRLRCEMMGAVSIHAPTKGATNEDIDFNFVSLFQSTLLRKERHSSSIVVHSVLEFQSTLLRKERLQLELYHNEILRVSIHAPTKGATREQMGGHPISMCFNPRSYERSDAIRLDGNRSRAWFQSTLLRKERPPKPLPQPPKRAFQSTLLRKERHGRFPGDSGDKRSFNPRSYERSDSSFFYITFIIIVSIHAPTKGATGSVSYQT